MVGRFGKTAKFTQSFSADFFSSQTIALMFPVIASSVVAIMIDWDSAPFSSGASKTFGSNFFATPEPDKTVVFVAKT